MVVMTDLPSLQRIVVETGIIDEGKFALRSVDSIFSHDLRVFGNKGGTWFGTVREQGVKTIILPSEVKNVHGPIGQVLINKEGYVQYAPKGKNESMRAAYFLHHREDVDGEFHTLHTLDAPVQLQRQDCVSYIWQNGWGILNHFVAEEITYDWSRIESLGRVPESIHGFYIELKEIWRAGKQYDY